MKTCGDFGGISVQTKNPCGRAAGWGTNHNGTGRCRRHGGNVLAGPAHPNFVHGKRSRYAHRLSADQQDDFHEALAAPDPFDLVDELALVRTLLTQEISCGPDLYSLRRILHQADEIMEEVLGGGGGRVEVALDAVGIASADDWDEEDNRKTAETLEGEALEKVHGLIREAYELLTGQQVRTSDSKAIHAHVAALRGLVDTSARVMDIRANSFTRVQSQALIARVVELIGTNVKDPQDRKRVLTALTYLSAEVAPAHQIAGKKDRG